MSLFPRLGCHCVGEAAAVGCLAGSSRSRSSSSMTRQARLETRRSRQRVACLRAPALRDFAIAGAAPSAEWHSRVGDRVQIQWAVELAVAAARAPMVRPIAACHLDGSEAGVARKRCGAGEPAAVLPQEARPLRLRPVRSRHHCHAAEAKAPQDARPRDYG
jgi:hypothetical protein